MVCHMYTFQQVPTNNMCIAPPSDALLMNKVCHQSCPFKPTFICKRIFLVLKNPTLDVYEKKKKIYVDKITFFFNYLFFDWDI